MDDTEFPRTRADAKAIGATHYFTGVPCKNGHIEKRSVSFGCMACRRSHSAKQRAENPVLTRQRTKEWFGRNPKYLGERRASRIDAERQREKGYREAHPEQERAKKRRYRQANAEKINADNRNRHARKMAAEGTHSLADIARIRKAQRDKCGYCRKQLNGGGHIDHIKPLVKRGENWSRNLQILCEPCNLKKHDRDPIDFARSCGLLL